MCAQFSTYTGFIPRLRGYLKAPDTNIYLANHPYSGPSPPQPPPLTCVSGCVTRAAPRRVAGKNDTKDNEESGRIRGQEYMIYNSVLWDGK
jgi:hypothetical protein